MSNRKYERVDFWNWWLLNFAKLLVFIKYVLRLLQWLVLKLGDPFHSKGTTIKTQIHLWIGTRELRKQRIHFAQNTPQIEVSQQLLEIEFQKQTQEKGFFVQSLRYEFSS